MESKEPGIEPRSANLPEFSADILKQWSATADRHARAVSELETQIRELGAAGSRLQHESTERLQELERIVQQEWSALRDIHDAPVRQLVQQATSLTEVSIATANSAQRGFDRAESRIAALEADFHRTTSELTREVHTLLEEVRQLAANGHRQLTGESAAWPLEGVTRLHQQLRDTPGPPRALPPSPALEAAPPLTAISSAPSGSSEPFRDLAPPPDRAGSLRWPVVGALVVVLAIGAFFAWRLQRDVRAANERVEQAQAESRAAVEKASREAAERQQAVARQLENARELAARAQTIGDVMAAPDLIRYTLLNPGLVPGAGGHVLFSRSRGFVFSASGLPPAPAASTYQVWLLTRAGAVSVTTFVPDSAGRVTVTAMPAIPRAVVGALVTREAQGGAAAPSGEQVLVRLPAAPAE